jgi:hypothetical protein
MATTLNNPAWLEWMAALMGDGSRQTLTVTLSPDRFHCLLDELPVHLIPQSVRRHQRPQGYRDKPLFLNPECILCMPGELPEEIEQRKDLVSRFALEATIAWVRDSVSGNQIPFWLGPRCASVLRNLEPGEPAPVAVEDDVRGLLLAAGILVPGGYAGMCRREWQERAEKHWPVFREKGYAAFPRLIHPFHVAALRRYYRFLIRTGAVGLGDEQCPRRYVAYNEPVARFFHHQIAATLSAAAGERLKPSYVYLASYLSGADLKKHTDREQCEFSVTFCLDFSPEPALATPWPIHLDAPTGTVTVYQALGDGLAYRGTRLPHYRDALAEGQTSTSIFFHYVADDFQGSLR